MKTAPPARTTAALLMVAAVGLALVIWSVVGRQRPGPELRIIPVNSDEGQQITTAAGMKPNPEHGPEVSTRSRLSAGDQVDYLTQLPPAKGRTIWVRPGAGIEGDGTKDSPWRGIGTRLKDLRGGDRVVLAAGRYRGPFELPPLEGQEPVEIVGRIDAVLYNDDEAESPVVRIEGRWSLIGLEIRPGQSSIGVEFVGDAPKELRHAHINSGGREGIAVRADAGNVYVYRTHVHHVGGPRRPGILIERGALNLRFEDNKVHGIDGDEIVLFEPGEFERSARGRGGARELRLPDAGIFIRESPWEP